MAGSSVLTARPAKPAGHIAMRGRRAEWQQVRELLRRAQRGLGGVLLVDGAAGMGKSLLLREAAREAAGQGFSLAAGRGDQLGRHVPFFALLAALHQPLGSSGAADRPGPPDITAGRIGQLQAHLEQRAAAGPVLVSLDDLQWASPATLLALRVLPRELASCPVAWLLAGSKTPQYKSADLLFRVLEDDGASRITLAPLSDDAVLGVLTDAFGMPPDRSLLALAARAAGHPALLSELVHGLAEENAVQVRDGSARLVSHALPQRIQHLARQRLDDLGRPAQQLVETAAVLGRSFLLEDATEMLGVTPATLLPTVEEAMDAGFLVTADDLLSFRHDLMWRAIANLIPEPARKALHRQFGEILLNRGGSALSAAAHLLEAAHTSDPATLAGLDRAAAGTLPTSPQTAARLALRALELTSPTDPAALRRSVAAAEALTAAGQLQPAARIVRETLAQPLPAIPDARLRCALSTIRSATGQALQAAAEARAALSPGGLPPELRDLALTAQLQAVVALRDRNAAAPLAARILAAPSDYDGAVVASAHVAEAMISWDQGRLGEALERLRDAARRGTGISPDARHFQPLLTLATCLVELRRFDEAETVIRAADNITLRGIPAEAVPALLRARIHLAHGRLGDAAAAAEAALAMADALGAHGYTSAAESVLGVIALRRGDLAAAAGHMANRTARMPHFAASFARTDCTVGAAQVAEAREGPAAVLSRVREICAVLPNRRGMLLGNPTAPAWLVRTALDAGDRGLAVQAAQLTGSLASKNPGCRPAAVAAAHSLGLLEQDAARLAHAAAQHDDPWARASAAEDLGVLLSRQGNSARAVHYMNEALDGYGQTEANADMARIRRRLRRLGVRKRHWASAAERPAAGWESLTETERTASELVAQGLNNRQVADRMYVSAHTIAFHLRQVFRKLNIGSRVELARIVLEQTQQSEPG
jgi:DNA-binding CsgD family transcriptional regulator/tetratricopeptide (TPR) repeat protein